MLVSIMEHSIIETSEAGKDRLMIGHLKVICREGKATWSNNAAIFLKLLSHLVRVDCKVAVTSLLGSYLLYKHLYL